MVEATPAAAPPHTAAAAKLAAGDTWRGADGSAWAAAAPMGALESTCDGAAGAGEDEVVQQRQDHQHHHSHKHHHDRKYLEEKLAGELERVGAVALSAAEGQQLVKRMAPEGRAAHECWMAAYEPQSHPAYCAPASLMAALKTLGLQAAWTQRRISEEVTWYQDSLTVGIGFADGVKLARLLDGSRLLVEERSSADKAQLAAVLQRDLDAAFVAGAQLRLLANYWRPTGGHWSPLGGWSDGKVLILDTNAERAEPHWVPLESLVAWLCRRNEFTGRPRGYLVLQHQLG